MVGSAFGKWRVSIKMMTPIGVSSHLLLVVAALLTLPVLKFAIDVPPVETAEYDNDGDRHQQNLGQAIPKDHPDPLLNKWSFEEPILLSDNGIKPPICVPPAE